MRVLDKRSHSQLRISILLQAGPKSSLIIIINGSFPGGAWRIGNAHEYGCSKLVCNPYERENFLASDATAVGSQSCLDCRSRPDRIFSADQGCGCTRRSVVRTVREAVSEAKLLRCHNVENSTAGIRVDLLDASFDDDQIRIWERGPAKDPRRHDAAEGPAAAHRRPNGSRWSSGSGTALEVARLRPAPKNGLVRRLTVAQYRNTLRELLLLDNDLTAVLPPDAVSKDGFLNNRDTLQLSPLLMEAYFEIAEKALDRAIVDPTSKPSIQNFRVDLGAGVNPAPLPEKLVLGAGSQLLENSDVLVTQLTPTKPFAFEPFFMRTKYRFIEGYRGNDTVRGWRDYDSIYHAVFADMRGSAGYPKGRRLEHRSAGTLAASGDSDRRDVRCRRHLRAEGELQDLAARVARRRPLPRDRHGSEIQRRPAARSRRTPRRPPEALFGSP